MRSGQCGYALDADKWLWQAHQIVHVATDGSAPSFCCANVGTCCYLKQLSSHKQWCCHCCVDKLSFILCSTHHGCWQLRHGARRPPVTQLQWQPERKSEWDGGNEGGNHSWCLFIGSVLICLPWTLVIQKKRRFHSTEGSKVTLRYIMSPWDLDICIDSLSISFV